MNKHTTQKREGKLRKVIVNFSGGVDSTAAALKALEQYPKEELLLCYQNTDADYLETPDHVRRIAKMLDLPLLELKDDLGFWGRAKQHGNFPLPSTRVCTRQLKQNQLRDWVRSHRSELGNELILIYGFRAEEGQARAEMQIMTPNNELTLKRQDFKAYYNLPVHRMNKTQVKEYVRANGLPIHPCYEFSERCSCWCCIFQPRQVVRAYAEVHNDLYEQACLVEDEIKHKWKDGYGFNDLMKQGQLL